MSITITNEQVYQKLLEIQSQLDQIQEGQMTMSEDQAHLNQEAADLVATEQEEEDTLARVEAKIAELKQSNVDSPNAPLDFTELDNALAAHKAFAAQLSGDAAPDEAPATDGGDTTVSTDSGDVTAAGGAAGTPADDSTPADDAPTDAATDDGDLAVAAEEPTA